MADGFYRSDDPTNSVKALKEGGCSCKQATNYYYLVLFDKVYHLQQARQSSICGLSITTPLFF